MKHLGEILLDEGYVTPADLGVALTEQAERGQSLGRVLVELGMLTEAQLVSALAQQVGMDFIELSDFAVDRAAVALVPGTLCRRHTVLPIGFENGAIRLAMADPGNVVAVDDVRNVTGIQVRPVVATRDDLLQAIDRYCRSDNEMEAVSYTHLTLPTILRV